MNYITLFILLLVGFHLGDSVSDPLKSSESILGIAPGGVVYRWTADVNKDGRNEVFIGTQKDYKWEKHNRGLPSWAVYIPNLGGASYGLSTGVRNLAIGPGIAPVMPRIDPKLMYIGSISQLGKSGVVTIQTDYPWKLPAVSYIRAYTIEGDHLKETLLAQYDPTKESNPIYAQYLSKEHRTLVRLDKIILE